MDIILQAHNLTKRFKTKTVVNGINFSVGRGQCFGFLGPNGAGKTTTLRMILGISPLNAGSLNIFGLAMPAKARQVRSRIGVVPQLDNLDPDFSVAENLQIYGSYFAIASSVLNIRIQKLLQFVGLQDRADSRIGTLSGGMLRRLTIARALVNDPELIILDEPTTGLDPQARHMIWAKLRDLVQEGKTLLLTSHYMEEAERLCDELVIMEHGSIIGQGSPRQLIRDHVEPEVVEMQKHNQGVIEKLSNIDNCRTELVGDTVYCYTTNAEPIVDKIRNDPGLAFLHRPANLEDVFLKLTGRELED